MEKYKDMTLKKKTNLKLIRNLIFFVALIIFTFWYIFKDQDLNELKEALSRANKAYIILAALLMLCVHLMESINVRSILTSLGEKNFSIFRALKYTAIGVFFSAITPAATGGQPVEIYYMSKDGIKPSNGTMAMLMQLCAFQISTIGLSIICALLNLHLLQGNLIWFYILGIVLNGTALTIMLLSVFSKKITRKLVDILIKIIKKLKTRNYELKIQKLEEEYEQYTKSAVFVKTHKKEFLKSLLRVTIQTAIFHSIPYFIYRAFNLNELTILNLFTMQAILYTTVSSIPLPGAIGISETLFLKLYGSAFGESILSGAMLLYRFVSFYLYILIFLIIVIINAIKNKDNDSVIDKNVQEIDNDIKDIKFKKEIFNT